MKTLIKMQKQMKSFLGFRNKLRNSSLVYHSCLSQLTKYPFGTNISLSISFFQLFLYFMTVKSQEDQ